MRALPLLLVFGCTRRIDAESPCREVAYAIASRTVDCTGDEDLATARAEEVSSAWTCLAPGPEANGADTGSFITPENLYHCAYTLRGLSCDEVDALGDDLDAWLATSPICDRILAPVAP